MLHDFVATERHLVFFVSPAIIRRARALLGLNPFAELVGWEPRRGSEVIVVPIDAPEAPCRFRVDAFYQWHFAGAFDVEDGVVVDAVTYPDLATLEALGGGVEGLEGGVLTRHRIDLRRQHLGREPLDDRPVEFPQLDPRHAGGAYRRLWLVGSDQLLQLDLSGDGAGAARRHPVSPALHASEPIFVPRSPDAEEGDGWVLTLVYDERSDTSHVAILDTRRFEDEPVARVWFDHHIPLTFHGLWQPARARASGG